MKKIITLLIALCIVLGCVTTPPFATLADETREFDSVDVLDDQIGRASCRERV